MRTIHTVGYEGLDLSTFVEVLASQNIDLVLDVRELPLSRRRGFSKTSLCEALEAAGIAYRHERDLGAPREVRHRVKRDGDWTRYFKMYRRHLNCHVELLDELAKELKGHVALLCFERDPTTCHRSVVARALADRSGRPIRHIVPAEEGEWTRVPDSALAAA